MDATIAQEQIARVKCPRNIRGYNVDVLSLKVSILISGVEGYHTMHYFTWERGIGGRLPPIVMLCLYMLILCQHSLGYMYILRNVGTCSFIIRNGQLSTTNQRGNTLHTLIQILIPVPPEQCERILVKWDTFCCLVSNPEIRTLIIRTL